jgi:large subunit ribosomal protein L1
MKKRSKRYLKNQEILKTAVSQNNNSDIFEIEKAVEILSQLENTKFKNGESVEIHFKLAINTTKSDQLVRSSFVLPNGTGKEVKITAFVNPENVTKYKKLGLYKVGSVELIEEIKESGSVDFDIAISEPEMMKNLPPIARILGTAGVMPNPKTGTVGSNIEEMVNLIKAGKVDFRNDKSGALHFIVGRNSFENDKLIANIQAGIEAVEKAKPEVIKKKFITSIHICSSMSPSIRIR